MALAIHPWPDVLELQLGLVSFGAATMHRSWRLGRKHLSSPYVYTPPTAPRNRNVWRLLLERCRKFLRAILFGFTGWQYMLLLKRLWMRRYAFIRHNRKSDFEMPFFSGSHYPGEAGRSAALLFRRN